MGGEPTFDDRLAVCKAAHSGMATLKMLDALARRCGDARLMNEALDRDVPGFFSYLAHCKASLMLLMTFSIALKLCSPGGTGRCLRVRKTLQQLSLWSDFLCAGCAVYRMGCMWLP